MFMHGEADFPGGGRGKVRKKIPRGPWQLCTRSESAQVAVYATHIQTNVMTGHISGTTLTSGAVCPTSGQPRNEIVLKEWLLFGLSTLVTSKITTHVQL